MSKPQSKNRWLETARVTNKDGSVTIYERRFNPDIGQHEYRKYTVQPLKF